MSNKQNFELVKSKLIIDSVSDKVFSGFIEKDQYWNGWVKPWFSKETTKSILDTFMYEWSYDKKTDTFTFDYPDDGFGPETVTGQDVLINSKLKHLYPLGNCSWIWDKYAKNDN